MIERYWQSKVQLADIVKYVAKSNVKSVFSVCNSGLYDLQQHSSKLELRTSTQDACSCTSAVIANCNTAVKILGPRVLGFSVYSIPKVVPTFFIRYTQQPHLRSHELLAEFVYKLLPYPLIRLELNSISCLFLVGGVLHVFQGLFCRSQ